MKRKILSAAVTLILLFAAVFPAYPASAAYGLDEIKDYIVTVTVNDDATLNIRYHIDWLVLDSVIEGPLEWVRVGIPNSHCLSYEIISTDTIRELEIVNDYPEVYARIDFKRSYKAGETVSFEFSIVQDYMYEVDKLAEGETVYEFTPGWFDEIEVNRLTLEWKAEKALRAAPDCKIVDGFYTWTKPLSIGEKYRISLTYPNDAYGFDLSKTIETGAKRSVADVFALVIGILIVFSPFVIVIISVVNSFKSYINGSGFGETETVKREKIVFYEECPECGTARNGSKDTCNKCGKSMIKSKKTVTEEAVKEEDEKALRYDADGLYRYTADPNTYIRIRIRPVTRTHSTGSRSSCVHSSCACACACAGGGRAGCSVKDFYKTGLKLSFFEKYAKPKDEQKTDGSPAEKVETNAGNGTGNISQP